MIQNSQRRNHRDSTPITGGSLKHTLTLYTLGSKRTVLKDFMNEAMQFTLSKDKEKTLIFMKDPFGMPPRWRRVATKPKRSFDSVILNSDLADQVLEDIREFLGSEKWYASMGNHLSSFRLHSLLSSGIPYRRGYLLHGKPGCGKTSFVAALAGILDLSVAVIDLSAADINDASLGAALRESPPNCILLLVLLSLSFFFTLIVVLGRCRCCISGR